MSRSAAIVCAYLMSENLWDFDRAIVFLREKRYRAKPNANFVQQLITYYNEHVVMGGKKVGEVKTERKESGGFRIKLEEQT